MPWSALGAAAAAGINYLSQRQANKENVALAQLQNQWNLEQWQRENEYNLPTNQVARLKAAGLNPNLAFENGAMVNEAAPSPSLVSGAGMIRPYQLDPLTAAQVANLNADTEQKKETTRSTEIKNAVDGMNAQAFETFFKQNENDIVRTMEQRLNLELNDYILSNYHVFEAAWDASIVYGLSFSDFYNSASNSTGLQDKLEDLLGSRYFDERFINERLKQHRNLFVGGRDAEIQANETLKALHEYKKMQTDKDIDVYSFIKGLTESDKPLEKAVGYTLYTMLFIAENKLSIPMPSFNIDAKRTYKYDQSDRSRTILKN